MKRSLLLLTLAALLPVAVSAQDQHQSRVARVLATTPLIDGHNDLPWEIRNNPDHPMDVVAYDLRQPTSGHTDIARLRAGGVGGQFWSVYIPCEDAGPGAARVQLEQIDIVQQIIRLYPDVFGMALTTSDVNREFGRGRIASMMGMEGGHAIENSLSALRAFYDAGVRYMTTVVSG